MRIPNRLRARLAAGRPVVAAWLETGSPEVAEILVRHGWDTVVIDCEHGAAGLEEGLSLIRAVEAAGGDAIVRVPDAAEATIKRALDRGARSLMVPMVASAAMARDVAACAHYAPRGRRGYAAPIVRASGYGTWAGYAAEAAEEVLVAIQVEHVDAVPQVAEMAAVPGVDMVFVGPNDLAASMGFIERLDAPEVAEAIARIEAATLAAGTMLGTIEGRGRDAGDLYRDGHALIVCPTDVGLLAVAARAEADRVAARLAGPGATG